MSIDRPVAGSSGTHSGTHLLTRRINFIRTRATHTSYTSYFCRRLPPPSDSKWPRHSRPITGWPRLRRPHVIYWRLVLHARPLAGHFPTRFITRPAGRCFRRAALRLRPLIAMINDTECVSLQITAYFSYFSHYFSHFFWPTLLLERQPSARSKPLARKVERKRPQHLHHRSSGCAK